MATVHIDGRRIEVDPHKNMLEVALENGFELPYFCWHPALGSVGACRQCAVAVETPQGSRIVMACMTAARDGTHMRIADPEAVEFRASVIEWLMLNHPHDCPVCDEGGECHLQDMTQLSGHVARRTRFPKRTYQNQWLGPFVHHEMNRCIQCYRCVRFYGDYAGGRDLQAQAAHDHVYFGRHEDGALESALSGNLVEVCPTGVFTDASFRRHFARKWDLSTAPSVCVHCGVGCNVTPGAQNGRLLRIRARWHASVNGHFVCDRGRYGYGFVNSEQRLGKPMGREGQALRELDAAEAIALLARSCASGRVMGIGSARATVESNFALRTLAGASQFFAGVDGREHDATRRVVAAARRGEIRLCGAREIAGADAVLVLGEDLPATAPIAALYVRQAARAAEFRVAERLGIPRWQDAAVREAGQAERSPVFVASPLATELDGIATDVLRADPDGIAAFGRAVAAALTSETPQSGDRRASSSDGEDDLAGRVANALAAAERPVVVAGHGCSSPAVVDAAVAVARALARKRGTGAHGELCFCPADYDAVGLEMCEPAGAFDAALRLAESGHIDTLVVLECDLFRAAERRLVERLLAAVGHLVVIDSIATATAARAELLLPATTFAEHDGHAVSGEGRAQRSVAVMPAPAGLQASWRWLVAGMRAAGRAHDAPWETLSDVVRALAHELPVFAALDAAVSGEQHPTPHAHALPRETHRTSGRTARRAHLTVLEPRPAADPDAPYAFSMEGCRSAPPRFGGDPWAPGLNSVQALTRFQEEIEGPLRGGDPGVRLLDADPSAEALPAVEPPAPLSERDGRWRVLPRWQVFGSDELSMLAPDIAARATPACATLHPDDARRLGAKERVVVAIDGRRVIVPLVTDERLPLGTVALPARLPALSIAPLPDWIHLEAA
jgi:NADH-quinone oxidoreductase subunit G